jgi:hypothetical protein
VRTNQGHHFQESESWPPFREAQVTGRARKPDGWLLQRRLEYASVRHQDWREKERLLQNELEQHQVSI